MDSRENDVNALNSSEQVAGSDTADLAVIDAIPIGISVLAPDGTTLRVNRLALNLIGVTSDEVIGIDRWARVCHPDDLERIGNERNRGLSEAIPFHFEGRILSKDGTYRWYLVQYSPLQDESGKVVRWYGTASDIEDRKRAEAMLQARELSWRQIVDNIPGFVYRLSPAGEPEFINRQTLEYFGKTNDELKDWSRLGIVHPDDLPRALEALAHALETTQSYEIEHRCRRADGVYRWFQVRGCPARDAEGNLAAWYFLITDIDDLKRAEERLQQSEAELRTITDTIRQPIVVMGPDSSFIYANQVALDACGLTRGEFSKEGFLARVCHPDDVERVLDERDLRLSEAVPFDFEARTLSRDGTYRWHLYQYNPLKDEQGQVIRWYATATDIDDRKRTEEILRQSEADLRTMIDAIRQYVVVLAPDGTVLHANRVALDITGYTIGEVNDGGFFPRAFHPDDVERFGAERQEKLLRGARFDLEMRLLLKDGQYRWQLFQYEPFKDDRGSIIRWYCTATDIDDRKKTEERLRNENVRLDQERVYLEEQIRSDLGYEQIIGCSPALKHVLELVETVAPSDSTVLLLGETGTGKELIARAVHERSRRKLKTLVKMNCAAIPTGLLESELFGHEKGAFTGAVVQKIGRMELADQSTLFLDEVGDIPIEIQPKLLRALQEKEFERLGSTNTRKVNVRLVAATNCNLEKMVAQRQFRSDLFYRLNVFPIRIPPLRERKEDIPLLVAYFVQKFARQMQKRINSIPAATMKALTAWDWPGNIRELENFIERAVILTRSDSLTAPLAELRKVTIDEPEESSPNEEHDIARIVEKTIASLKGKTPESEHAKRQQEEIMRVLAECKGRVGGADGAAARMGLSRTTLISRMKKLGISPYDYA